MKVATVPMVEVDNYKIEKIVEKTRGEKIALIVIGKNLLVVFDGELYAVEMKKIDRIEY